MSYERSKVKQLFVELRYEKIQPFVNIAIQKKLNSNEFVAFMTSNIRNMLRRFPYRDRLNLFDDVKNNGKATNLRRDGNKMFHPNVKRYIEAIKLYNQAITLSQKGSEERALAYGNRSIICLEMQRYEECLENIRLARESNYPERLKGKLDERETSAKQALAKMADKKATSSKDSSEVVEELQLSYPSHENALHIANCLVLQKNDHYGRHVVTNRKLNVGDVVMIDKPFVTVLEELLRHVRCDFCHAERLFILIPCEGCSAVMYCSEECLSKAFNKYHRYECGVISRLWKIGSELFVTAFRSVAIAFTTFDNDPEALREHLDSLDEASVNAFTMDWNHATPKDIFNTAHVLMTNQEKQVRDQLLLRIFYMIIVQDLVLERTELGNMCEENPKLSDTLANMILHYMQSVECNLRSMCFMELDVNYGLYKNAKYAHGCFPLVNMLNHSCASNVASITLRDGRYAVIVVRPIAEGGQLFDNYEMHHFLYERKQRQLHLLKIYKFACMCEACRGNYPTYDAMKQAREMIAPRMGELKKLIDATIIRHDSKKALEVIAELCPYLNLEATRYPSYDVCAGQIDLKTCYTIAFQGTSECADYWNYCNP